MHIFVNILAGDSNINTDKNESLSIPLLYLPYFYWFYSILTLTIYFIVILCKYYKSQPIPDYNLLDQLYITVLTLFPGHTRTRDEFI